MIVLKRSGRFINQPILGQEQRSASRQQFEFISVSGTNIRGNAETRRRVRSRAQADYRRRNPPPPRNALTVDLDVGSWLQALSPHQEPESLGMQPPLQTGEITQINTTEYDPISADNSANIFSLVPADQRPRARQLWNHRSYFPTCPSFFIPSLRSWF